MSNYPNLLKTWLRLHGARGQSLDWKALISLLRYNTRKNYKWKTNNNECVTQFKTKMPQIYIMNIRIIVIFKIFIKTTFEMLLSYTGKILM